MAESIIETNKLCYGYTKQRQEISNLSLHVPKGIIYGFLCPDGSGKSTSIRLLLGLLKNQSGSIKIFDQNIYDNRLKSLNKIVALIENPSLYDHLNAINHLRLITQYKNRSVSRNQLEEILELPNAKKKTVEQNRIS